MSPEQCAMSVGRLTWVRPHAGRQNAAAIDNLGVVAGSLTIAASHGSELGAVTTATASEQAT